MRSKLRGLSKSYRLPHALVVRAKRYFNAATETEGIVRSLEELLRRTDLERVERKPNPRQGGRRSHWPRGFDTLYGSWKGAFEELEDPPAE